MYSELCQIERLLKRSIHSVAGSKAQQTQDAGLMSGMTESIAGTDAVSLHRRSEDDVLGILFAGKYLHYYSYYSISKLDCLFLLL